MCAWSHLGVVLMFRGSVEVLLSVSELIKLKTNASNVFIIEPINISSQQALKLSRVRAMIHNTS